MLQQYKQYKQLHGYLFWLNHCIPTIKENITCQDLYNQYIHFVRDIEEGSTPYQFSYRKFVSILNHGVEQNEIPLEKIGAPMLTFSPLKVVGWEIKDL